jgi:hypothetical protein
VVIDDVVRRAFRDVAPAERAALRAGLARVARNLGPRRVP